MSRRITSAPFVQSITTSHTKRQTILSDLPMQDMQRCHQINLMKIDKDSALS